VRPGEGWRPIEEPTTLRNIVLPERPEFLIIRMHGCIDNGFHNDKPAVAQAGADRTAPPKARSGSAWGRGRRLHRGGLRMQAGQCDLCAIEKSHFLTCNALKRLDRRQNDAAAHKSPACLGPPPFGSRRGASRGRHASASSAPALLAVSRSRNTPRTRRAVSRSSGDRPLARSSAAGSQTRIALS